MLNVVCVKSKPAYDHHYVNRLYEMVRRNLTIPHKFTCFTDDSSGIRCKTKPLPSLLAKSGWWAKLSLHREDLLTCPVLYLDLDTLIVDNLDFIGDYKGDFCILRDFYRPEGYGSGVMMWNKPHPYVWTKWVGKGCPSHGLGDQGWMEEQIKGADLFQDQFPDKFVSYKVDCQSRLPENASVVCFHGEPKPHQFPEDHWVSQHWVGELVE